ncbi:MAG: GNAT family N-acetyltransferase [Clostridia bacterium]|nr:GNAT family N-acetyltransferase [Clostridia bacterium]
MRIDDIAFTLRDGRRAILRNPREEDIEGTLEYLKISAAETEFILRTPEECAKYTYEGEKAFFEARNESPNGLMLMAVVDGRVAGNCEINFRTGAKTRHRADIGIALIREFWNLGIGTRMFEALIEAARAREGVTQLELEFVEGNDRARHLYEKMGFRITGLRPDAIRLSDGRFVNEYQMTLKL